MVYEVPSVCSNKGLEGEREELKRERGVKRGREKEKEAEGKKSVNKNECSRNNFARLCDPETT